MVCRECGASYVPFRSVRLAIWRLARKIRSGQIAARRQARERRPTTAPSLTELVAMLERDQSPTIFG
jgi:hypothetical protein